MINKKQPYLIFVFILLFITFSCSHSNTKVKETIGEADYAFIQKAKNISFFTLFPSEKDKKREITSTSIKKLTKARLDQLKTFILEDSNFLFGQIKKTVFIPQYGFKIGEEDQLSILISPTGKQLKIIKNEKTILLNYDPMDEKFSIFLKELIEFHE